MVRTTRLKLGELIMAATVSRVLAPDTKRLCATGVAQLVQTPSGDPATTRQSTLAAVEGNRFGAVLPAKSDMIAAPKGNAKYMPKRLA
jgi:hypothetical protein